MVRNSRVIATVALTTMIAAACGLDSGKPPSVSGPSEFGLSITLTATPDQLPRDGSSQSTITVFVRDAQNRPVSGQRLSIGTTVGSVSQGEVVTGGDGRASFTFIAPPAGTVGNTAIIQVIPVGDNAGNAIGRTVSILLMGVGNSTAPTPSFTVTPSAPVLKEAVVFDASATTDEGSVCRDACTYSWDFGGEASGSGRVFTYRFQNVRTYAVKLTVTDAAGSAATLTQNVTVTAGTLPTAVIVTSPASPGQFEKVQFDGSRSTAAAGRTVEKWEWNFGDGTKDTGVTTSHAYSVIGSYNVTLTVTDSAGLKNAVQAIVAVVSGVVAAFNYSPTNPRTTETVVFNAEESRGSDNGFGGRNTIKNYIWHFGKDEELRETTSPRISETFPKVRTYTVTLTVVDTANRRQTTNQTIAIAAP